MGKDAMLEHIEPIRNRSIQSVTIKKNTVLSEFCAATGYDRKYAINLLGGKVAVRSKQSAPKAVCNSDFMVSFCFSLGPSSIDRLLRPYKVVFSKGLLATAEAFLKSQLTTEPTDRSAYRPSCVQIEAYELQT